MDVEYVASGEVRAGKLQVRNRAAFDKALARFRDGEVQVRIAHVRATRSEQQNRWYWAVIVEAISEHTGYTADEVHEFLKAKFIPKRLAVCDGNGVIQEDLVIGGSTAKLNKLTFGEYCEAIRGWAAETLEINIPDPQ
jgi:hypothetical protein